MVDVGVRHSVAKKPLFNWLFMFSAALVVGTILGTVLGTDFGDLLHSSEVNLNQNECSVVGALPELWPADLSTADQAPQN